MQEDIPQQIEEKVAAASRIERTGAAKSKGSTSDDEGSVAGAPVSAAAKRARGCAVCGTKTAKEWFRCPESLGQTSRASSDIHVMCDECGFRWRHCECDFSEDEEEGTDKRGQMECSTLSRQMISSRFLSSLLVSYA